MHTFTRALRREGLAAEAGQQGESWPGREAEAEESKGQERLLNREVHSGAGACRETGSSIKEGRLTGLN